MPPGHGDAGLGGDVLEAPIAQVAVQGVRPFVAREVDVGKPVAVDVAQRHAPALRQMAVPERAVEGDRVDEADAGPRSGQLSEARSPPARGHMQLAPAVPRSEEHTSELQSPCNLVCRLLLEKKKN